MENNELAVDRRAIAVWRWEATGIAFVALAASGGVLWARAPAWPFAVAWLLLCAALVAWVSWYPAARHRHLRYRADAAGMTIRAGVIFRVQSAVPRVRIQHTDVYQGPLQRHYGIATLKLYTAGTHYTKIELPGLLHADALALRDDLQRESDGDAV